MKNISYAATIAGLFLVIGGGGSLGVTGCASAANPGFGSGDDGGTDGGVAHSEGGAHHDGGGGGNDSGGGGNDSGGGGGDCTAFCMKESAVTGCPSQAQCETNCQSAATQAGAKNCASQYSTVLTCATTTGTIASCSSTGVAQITGCDAQIMALTACAQMGTGDAGMNCGVMTANPTCTACIDSMCCSQGQACAMTAGNECINLSMCYAGCNMVQTCYNTCDTMHPNGVTPLNNLGMCLQTNCMGSCP